MFEHSFHLTCSYQRLRWLFHINSGLTTHSALSISERQMPAVCSRSCSLMSHPPRSVKHRLVQNEVVHLQVDCGLSLKRS